MSKDYKSSVSFGVLKGIEEHIVGNFSSRQYAEVLDTLLYSAAQDIVLNTNWFDRFLPRILNWYATNSNRKLTNISKEKLQTLVGVFLLVEPPDKLELLKQMSLERNLVFLIINTFVEQTRSIKHVTEHCSNNCHDGLPFYRWITELQNVTGGKHLYCTSRNAEFWITRYVEFRGFLIEKYTRLAITQAQRLYVEVKHELVLSDIISQFMLSVGRAIDKYDCGRGSLTAYIQVWFKNARTQVFKELEQTRNTSSLDELIENKAWSPAELPSVETDIERKQDIQLVRDLAKIVDPQGWARIKLGIEEIL